MKESRDTKNENLTFEKKKHLEKRNRKKKISTLLQPVTGFNGRELFEDFYSGKFHHFHDNFCYLSGIFCFFNEYFEFKIAIFHHYFKEDYGNKKQKYSKFIQSIFTKNHIIFEPKKLVNLGLKIRFETRRPGGRP